MDAENLSNAGRENNPDPNTKNPKPEPSKVDPVSTGVGAVAGGAAGAAIGSAVGGPVGTVVGAVVGAVAGGLGGHAIGKAVDPDAEDAYWRSQHSKQPYARSEVGFEEYRLAYRVGYEGYAHHEGDEWTFEEAEPNLRRDYEAGSPTLPWEKAREASRHAWNRVQRGEAVRLKANP